MCDENWTPLLHLKSVVLLSVFNWELAAQYCCTYEGAFTHLFDAVNKASVVNARCHHDIYFWNRISVVCHSCGVKATGSVFTSKLVFACFPKVGPAGGCSTTRQQSKFIGQHVPQMDHSTC